MSPVRFVLHAKSGSNTLNFKNQRAKMDSKSDTGPDGFHAAALFVLPFWHILKGVSIQFG